MVIASDMMATFHGGLFTADITLMKGRGLVGLRWGVAFAGDDMNRVEPIIRRSITALADDADPSVDDVAGAMLTAYHSERREFATEMHLATYGMDMQQFLSNGLNVFGDQGFAVLRQKLEQTVLSCDLLIHGFDAAGHVHLVSIENGFLNFIPTKYWSIGSGNIVANSRLALRFQNIVHTAAETVWHVCEAKAAAESAAGVGWQTKVIVIERDRKAISVDGQMLEYVMGHCRSAIRPKVDQKVIDSVDQFLTDAKASAATKRSKIQPAPKD